MYFEFPKFFYSPRFFLVITARRLLNPRIPRIDRNGGMERHITELQSCIKISPYDQAEVNHNGNSLITVLVITTNTRTKYSIEWMVSNIDAISYALILPNKSSSYRFFMLVDSDRVKRKHLVLTLHPQPSHNKPCCSDALWEWILSHKMCQ